MMRKQVIDTVSKCYSVNALNMGKERWLLFAGEGDGSLQAYHGENFREKEVLWDESAGLGGIMSICTVPEKEGWFFVSTGFFTMIQSESSSIYLVRRRDGKFEKEKVCDIPYLHRFDVFVENGHRYLLACTLHEGKKEKDDWSTAGKILTAELPMDLEKSVETRPRVLMEGLFQNHGFNRLPGKGIVLIACREGVYQVNAPSGKGAEWNIEKLFDFPASDVCAFDLDGDGELEYGIISPFHGNRFCIYKRTATGIRKLYEHEKPLNFYHAIYADILNGRPVFVIGARKEDMDLYQVFWDESTQKLVSELIETGAGSSNVRIVHTGDKDFIMSANRQKNEAAIYMETEGADDDTERTEEGGI